jgi:hypothetical protein
MSHRRTDFRYGPYRVAELAEGALVYENNQGDHGLMNVNTWDEVLRKSISYHQYRYHIRLRKCLRRDGHHHMKFGTLGLLIVRFEVPRP